MTESSRSNSRISARKVAPSSQGSSARSTVWEKGRRRDHGRESENQTDIGDVRSDRVAHRDQGIAFHRCGDGNENLGSGGAERDHGQADQHLRHTHVVGGAGGTGQELVRTPDQSDEPDDQRQYIKPHVPVLS